MGDEQVVERARLLEQLGAARADEPQTIAILWTWLEDHRMLLGSQQEKLSAIKARVQEEAGPDSVDDETLAWIAEDPLPRAAELLARIGERLSTNSQQQNLGGRSFDETTGFDGRPVIVALRHPRLALLVGGDHGPPDAIENPSLAALAPNLAVSATDVEGMRLTFAEPDDPAWDLVWQVLEDGLGPPPRFGFAVHLDPLREHGIAGWLTDEDRPVGHYDAAKLGKEGQKQCIAAAREAIANVESGASILVLPELAAAPAVEEAIKEELRARQERGDDTPTLTVVGLYHLEPAPGTEIADELVTEDSLAPYVNEVVVLGPGGEELWRQRKMSYAEGELDDEWLAEDIQLGTELTVVPTPLGHVGIAICLDSFAQHTRARIAASAAEVVLVPSLSPHSRRHRISLLQLVWRLCAIAFVCNRSPVPSEDGVAGWNDDENRSFWAVQHEPEVVVPPAWDGEGHPSFVFRLTGPAGRLIEAGAGK